MLHWADTNFVHEWGQHSEAQGAIHISVRDQLMSLTDHSLMPRGVDNWQLITSSMVHLTPESSLLCVGIWLNEAYHTLPWAGSCIWVDLQIAQCLWSELVPPGEESRSLLLGLADNTIQDGVFLCFMCSSLWPNKALPRGYTALKCRWGERASSEAYK